MQRDNSTYKQKVMLRRKMLEFVSNPVIMETHGGAGKIFDACYGHVEQGVVFEKDDRKLAILGKQRPTWAVYGADCVGAIAGGVGNHLPVNVLDVDPYGDPWPTITAFFASDRPRPNLLAVVVNDGLRQKVRQGGSWDTATLAPMVRQYGNDLHGIYLEICQELMIEKAGQAGYALARWAAYYCGHAKQMSHYLAILER